MNTLDIVIDYILRIINKFSFKIKYDYEIYPIPGLEMLQRCLCFLCFGILTLGLICSSRPKIKAPIYNFCDN